MKQSVWMRGMKIVGYCSVGVVSILGGMAWLVSPFSDHTLLDAMIVGINILTFLGLTLWILRSRYMSHRAGPLLLDCGPVPKRGLFVFGACIMTFSAVLILLPPYGPLEKICAVLYLSMAFYQGYMALGRLQFREAGIWKHRELVTWDKIESWQWEDGRSPNLLIQVKTRFPGFNRCELPIPSEQHDWTEAFLQEHCTPTAH